jgi:hypothetical protein
MGFKDRGNDASRRACGVPEPAAAQRFAKLRQMLFHLFRIMAAIRQNQYHSENSGTVPSASR